MTALLRRVPSGTASVRGALVGAGRAVRPGLRSLTVRGRGFLTSGVTAAVCGTVLLERDLVRVGILVAAVPLVALLTVMATRARLQVDRRPEPAELSVGETGSVALSVTNTGPYPSSLLVEEQLPYVLGQPPRFSLLRLDGGQVARLEYAVRPELRGRYALGPLEVRHREPFGMMELRREVPGTHSLLVLPRVVELDSISLLGDGTAAGEERPRAYSTGTVADASVRGYRRGDDLRRVHWPTTARVGELMVRNEEQLWQPRATVVLDDRAIAHRGVGAASSLESAVTATASVVAHLAERGYQVRLVTGSGTHDIGLADSHGGSGVHDLLAVLADLTVIGATSLPDVTLDDQVIGAVVVGVLGTGALRDPVAMEHDTQWWARLSMVAGQPLALALDTTGWGGRAQDRPGSHLAPDDGTRATAWLHEHGWRTAVLTKDGSLADAWKALAR